MSQPEIVQSALDGETVVSRIHLGGEDELFVTPSRTLVYRAEGLLSDESVDEYPLNAERISVSEGRRKGKILLDYGLDGSEKFGLSVKRLDEALQPILEGVLTSAGVLDADESVVQAFRFSELTLIVAEHRLVRHIGSAVWDEDYDAYHYDDVTDLEFESGSVATTVVLTSNGRQERFKTPNEQARLVRESLSSSLCAHHGVGSLEEFRLSVAPDEEDEADADRDNTDFGAGPDPLSANPGELAEEPKNATRSDEDGAQQAVEQTVEATSGAAGATAKTSESTQNAVADAADLGFEGSAFESAADSSHAESSHADLEAEIETLREVVEAQTEQIQQQQQLLEQLIEELRRGR
ncbi:hypothetical protein ACFQJC_02515 [Haloferax namakaokahaiae]|uniref:DUF7115 domain-containing protein n=1 Tax=Haloferax namakaokahaiae TaxID=1748331 RepID=A0ABD5ZAU9_9EURY